MLYDSTMPMPGVLRLRALHPLIEGDGSCSMVYDLERAAVVEVPEELTFYIATALETGDLDEALLAWLANEDLLTDEGAAGSAGGRPPETAVWWHSGAIYRVDDELHARIDQVREEAALDVVRFAFSQGFVTSRVRLHLNWDGDYPGNGLLERIAVEASRLAASLHQEVAFELTLDADEVTPARAAFLAASAFQVRLRCGGYPVSSLADRGAAAAAWKAEPLVHLLLKHLRDRLTVHCVLDGGRLLDLWEWAKRIGIHHLDATLVEDSAIGDGSQRPGRRSELRGDLLAVCDEMAEELAAQRMPVDYKPLTRIVDRLMRSESLDETAGDRGFAGLVPVADSYPRSLLESFDLHSLVRSLDGAETATAAAEAGETDLPCPGCWARHVCSHSTFVASAMEGEEARDISEDSCSLWKVEVEVALRFYHRLAHTDPLQVRRFFDSATRQPARELGEELGSQRMPF